MKRKTKIYLSTVFVFLACFLVAHFSLAYDYTPMEKIPGFEDAKYFPDYISAIYKFGLWAIGIAALLMISVGGFMYFTSAGNTANLEKAKAVIRDAIIGVIAVMVAWLLLYVINPDLIGGNLSSMQNMRVSDSSTSTEYIPPTKTGTGSAWPDSAIPLPPGTLLDDEARNRLSTEPMKAIAVNKANCTYVGQESCTSLDGIPSSTIDKLVAIRNGGTDFTVTGGTEHWLHKTHGPGRSIVDIYPNASKSEWDAIYLRLMNSFGVSPSSFCDLKGQRVNCSVASHIHLIFN
ncbi:hypothetical protein BMS3Abin15_00914 [bacterium BMS3Abin15]|nr:hypothetical protein BMS3Abin15_00914 [bacterium BMS3Abin15]